MATIREFVKKNRIKAEVRWADKNPNMEDTGPDWRHFRVTLRRAGKQLTVPFSQGPAIEQEPTAEDVLNCLALDANGYANAQSFEEWAREYGYDSGSRKAEKIYRTVQRQTEKLERFLPPDLYDSLLWHTESL